jgi:hypothetical protein
MPRVEKLNHHYFLTPGLDPGLSLRFFSIFGFIPRFSSLGSGVSHGRPIFCLNIVIYSKIQGGIYCEKILG